MSGTPGGGLSRPGFGERRNIHSERLASASFALGSMSSPIQCVSLAWRSCFGSSIASISCPRRPTQRNEGALQSFAMCSAASPGACTQKDTMTTRELLAKAPEGELLRNRLVFGAAIAVGALAVSALVN